MNYFDMILSNACPNVIVREGDENHIGQVALYWIETHCLGWWVTAELVYIERDGDNVKCEFEIHKMESEDV